SVWMEHMSFLHMLASMLFMKTSSAKSSNLPMNSMNGITANYSSEGSHVQIYPSVAKLRDAYLSIKPTLLATQFIQNNTQVTKIVQETKTTSKTVQDTVSLPTWTTSFWQHLGSKLLQSL